MLGELEILRLREEFLEAQRKKIEELMNHGLRFGDVSLAVIRCQIRTFNMVLGCL